MTVPMNAIPKSGDVGRAVGQRGEAGAKGGEAFGDAFAQVGRENGGKAAKEKAPAAGETGQRPDVERQSAGAGRQATPNMPEDPSLNRPHETGESAAPSKTAGRVEPATPRVAPAGEPVPPRHAGSGARNEQAETDLRVPGELPRTSDGRLDLAELLTGKKAASAGESVPETKQGEANGAFGEAELPPIPGEASTGGAGEAATSERAAVTAPATENATAAAQAPAATARDWAAALTAFSAARGGALRSTDATTVRAERAGAKPTAAAAMPKGEGDDLFRFAQAEGKAESLPGHSSADRLRAALAAMVREPGGTDARQVPGTNVDANAPEFSILESRKFLGVATGQTAVASVVSAVTENAEWNAMLRQASATAATTLNAARNVANSLKIQLSPVELGTVTATLKMSGGHLSVELKVETIEAYRQLSSGENSLVRALRGQGYDIDQVILHQPTSGDRGQAAGVTPTASSAQGGGGQPAGSNAEGGQAGNGQQRGGEAGRGGQHHHQGERHGETGGMAGERNRAGNGVYL